MATVRLYANPVAALGCANGLRHRAGPRGDGGRGARHQCPQFLGFEFYLQGGVLVLGYNPGGLVFSNALHGVVGR
ncbi:MAG: hypothetical protein H6835_01745 [Planctomycetes bacterium]|nr:hypothetical protein [Planctomycetota bacterium]